MMTIRYPSRSPLGALLITIELAGGAAGVVVAAAVGWAMANIPEMVATKRKDGRIGLTSAREALSKQFEFLLYICAG